MEKRLDGKAGCIDPERVAEIIIEGGTAVLPTDTIYGLHASSANREAVKRVAGMKGRSADEPFVLLASGIEMAETLVASWENNSYELLGKIWPAPLTAILHAVNNLPTFLSKDRKVAIRVPKNTWLLDLINRIGRPLISTSVNRSGEPPLESISEIREKFENIDLCIERAEDGGTEPSTIIDFTANVPVLLREGAFSPSFRTIRPRQ